ncbi:MAG: hypothetical protein ACM3PY_05960 [Omnitrophica WOR_2 bacterium]
MARLIHILRRLFKFALWIFILLLLLGGSSMRPASESDRVRVFTRSIEFDYVSWIVNAIAVKIDQSALGTSSYLPETSRHQEVVKYLKLVAQIQQAEGQLNEIYADPHVKDPQTASVAVRQQLAGLRKQRDFLAPLAEGILQSQVSSVAAELGLTVGGQPIPPVLYHATPLPMALIVSPRNTIRQDEDISLLPGITVDQQAELESKVDRALNVSSLVVPVGGIGVYPTMVMQTTDLNWLAEVVSHEWTHNFLTIRPLGMSYENTPELRVMNETTASIAGKEIGSLVIREYYPELVPPPLQPDAPAASKPGQPQPPQPPPFDFRAEMHITRLAVDKLLAEGKIDEAERYMEQRRQFFWDHGYHIRKLNQAYFAFYGAYADQPGGAAGVDPVGAAVRALRAQSKSLADFLYRISWFSSFSQLEQAVQANGAK